MIHAIHTSFRFEAQLLIGENVTKMLVVAHRGASAYKPENTFLSFTLAVELGADMVEVDVRQSKDGHLIVFHDETVERTTNGKGFVKNLTLKELKSLDAGLGSKIPTLSEAASLLRGKAGMVVEVKALGIERRVVETLDEAGIVEDVIVTSFFHPVLKKIKSLCPKVRTGVIISSRPVHPSKIAFDAEADAIFPRYKYVDEDFVLEAHKDGLLVFPWTVDSADQVESLAKMGVDGVVTNKPDVAVKELSLLGFR